MTATEIRANAAKAVDHIKLASEETPAVLTLLALTYLMQCTAEIAAQLAEHNERVL